MRFSFIPNIQTTVELKGTGMQGVKRKFLVFANLIFFCISGVEDFGDSNNVKVTMDKCSRLNFVKQKMFSLNVYLQLILMDENYTITDIPRCFINA